MRKSLLCSVLILAGLASASAQDNLNTITIFDEVVFYDGYLMDKNPDKDVEDGILRHSCSLYATKLTDPQLDALGLKLDVNVTVSACCDNYDRIGNINLAFVPKGSETYDPQTTPRIEIGRFITPFMDKNVKPNQVPYAYEMDYISTLLRDEKIREDHDIWIEFELFGIPYAANTQIKGCEGRSDVFAGTLEFATSTPAGPAKGAVLVPIVIKKPEYIGNNLNNYNEVATDEIGKTVKTYTFEVPEDVLTSQIVLITSNHGANNDGEEYNRRWHNVYLDDELVLVYRPGRNSCEPFRQYNTQSNGIYGQSKKSDALWQSFSNWCPGDVIDNRIIDCENLSKGEHKVRIEVLDAVFPEQQGDIPVSMFFLGSTEAEPNSVKSLKATDEYPVKIFAKEGSVFVDGNCDVDSITVYSYAGEKLAVNYGNSSLETPGITGFVIVCVEMADGMAYSAKIKL